MGNKEIIEKYIQFAIDNGLKIKLRIHMYGVTLEPILYIKSYKIIENFIEFEVFNDSKEYSGDLIEIKYNNIVKIHYLDLIFSQYFIDAIEKGVIKKTVFPYELQESNLKSYTTNALIFVKQAWAIQNGQIEKFIKNII